MYTLGGGREKHDIHSPLREPGSPGRAARKAAKENNGKQWKTTQRTPMLKPKPSENTTPTRNIQQSLQPLFASEYQMCASVILQVIRGIRPIVCNSSLMFLVFSVAFLALSFMYVHALAWAWWGVVLNW